MPIRFPQASPQITAAFTRNLPEGRRAVARRGEGVPGLEGVHQVYYAPPTTLKPGSFLQSAKPVAWRHNQGTPEAAMEAEIDVMLNPQNTSITSLTQGPFAHEPMALLPQLTGTDEGEGAPASELRMLRVPEVKLMAVWLHSEMSDVFIPLAPCPRSLTPGKRYSLAELSQTLAPTIAKLAELKEGAGEG